ncbi:maleylpyruvate isomerase family mycothiol-dependent enzyme [Ornithinimicrobium sp. W1679]|uniref:maleylpyruvate isomerase family mycothiol-dependent enzyme n=1 Tax=Ornithinimicrobium sp. W1679 TaxID=3418770 RepID=UPI003CFA32FD
MTNRAAENLALLDVETARLLTTCRGLVAAGAGAAAPPTLCEGWDAARLLTHLARNADALGNLVRWAGDGVERQAYASVAQRDRDIETGARRPLAEIVADVEVTASRFRELAGTLTGPAGEAQVRTRTGTPVQGHQVVAMRVLEVVFHHVDLQAGYTFDDADPAWVARTLRRGVARWEAAGEAPGLTLVPVARAGEGTDTSGMPPLQLSGGGAEVSGTPGQLLLWLARGRTDGLSTDVDLPTPPPWA